MQINPKYFFINNSPLFQSRSNTSECRLNRISCDTVSFQRNVIEDEKLIKKLEGLCELEIFQKSDETRIKFEHRKQIWNIKNGLFRDILNGTKKWPGVRTKVKSALSNNSHYSFQDLMKDLNIPENEIVACKIFFNADMNKKGKSQFTKSLFNPMIKSLDLSCKVDNKLFNTESKPLIGKRVLDKIISAKIFLHSDISDVHKAKYLLLEEIEKFTKHKLETNHDYDNYNLIEDLGIPDNKINSWNTFLNRNSHRSEYINYPECLIMPILKKLNIADRKELKAFNPNFRDKLILLKDNLDTDKSAIHKAKYNFLKELEKFVKSKLKSIPNYSNSDLMKDLVIPEDQINCWKVFINPELQEAGSLNYTYKLINPILEKLNLENRKDLNVFSEKKGHLVGTNFTERIKLVRSKINPADSNIHNAKHCLLGEIENYVNGKLQINKNYSHTDFIRDVKIPTNKINIWLHFINQNRQSSGALYYTKDIVEPILKALGLDLIKELKCYRGKTHCISI